MPARTHWDSEEVVTARRMFAAGMTWAQVGEELGRTGSACRDAVSRYYGKIDDPQTCYDGPPIALTMECVRYRANCLDGSSRLAVAINSLIERMPPRAVSRILGKPLHPIPGTERIIYGQAAERMLAA